ncbi:MAG: polyprenol monophosphomannose synthase [Patescibacteria group bacterium]
MRSTVILPTYNERENLREIVEKVLSQGIQDLSILVVDDDSPDGTGNIADELAMSYPAVSVLHRPHKEGLGRAYIAGFRRTLEDPSVELIFEMDADHSHQPKYLPLLIEAAAGADVVLGSRYMEGGGVQNWGAFRRFISWFANTTIRWILGVPIRDLTGGFKCFHRRVLEALDLDRVASRGYNFQIEMTYEVYIRGYTVREIPIVFIERRAGSSKFSIMIMLESFVQVLLLRFRQRIRRNGGK